MNNKLGIAELKAIDVEEKIVKLKIDLIDEEFDFNIDYNDPHFDVKYILKLHEFLFGDIYENTDKFSYRVDKNEIIWLENELKNIKIMISNKDNIDDIVYEIESIIDYQLFDDGNNRTIAAFFSRYIKIQLLSGFDEYYQNLLEIINNRKDKNLTK